MVNPVARHCCVLGYVRSGSTTNRCRTGLTTELRRPRTLRAQQDQMHVVTLRHDRATGTVCMDASAEVHVRLQGRTAQVQQVGPLWPTIRASRPACSHHAGTEIGRSSSLSPAVAAERVLGRVPGRFARHAGRLRAPLHLVLVQSRLRSTASNHTPRVLRRSRSPPQRTRGATCRPCTTTRQSCSSWALWAGNMSLRWTTTCGTSRLRTRTVHRALAGRVVSSAAE